MPELPDITVYVESLQRLVAGDVLREIQLRSPFLLRTALPPWRDAQGRGVTGVERLAKRIVIELEGELFLVFHLMRLGRFQWLPAAPPPAAAKAKAKVPASKAVAGGRSRSSPSASKALLARFLFDRGTLVMTEQGTKKRASLHLVQGRPLLSTHDRGGLEVMGCALEAFEAALARESHTLKRALTDPRLFSGIGNAYSDEILHAARLSPVQLTSRLDADERRRLWEATLQVLAVFTDRIRADAAATEGFPAKVTAFRDDMAVHGRFAEPCPVCRSPVQRIVYADRETHYCARCQTGGQRLADRALSRLLGKDWPRDMDALEEGKA